MQNGQELIDTYLVNDDKGSVYTVEVQADVTYSDESGVAKRTVGVYKFCLRDGSRLIRHRDESFINTSTGKVLRRLPQSAQSVVAPPALRVHVTVPSTKIDPTKAAKAWSTPLDNAKK